jgi:hypothetical protein
VLLLLKLVLAPSLVAAASLVEQRFGHRAGGWVAGFPIVAGPILLFLALEQGRAFAATAAHQTLLGLVSLAAYCVAYERMSRTAPAAAALPVAFLAFAIVTPAMAAVQAPLAVALLLAVAALLTARALLAAPADDATRYARPSLLLRMGATAAIVLTVTGLAHVLGPRWSGLLVPFPVASTVLLVAAHRAAGHGAVVRVLRGLLPALCGFALFCTAVASLLPRHGIAVAFAAGLAASVLSQGVALRQR